MASQLANKVFLALINYFNSLMICSFINCFNTLCLFLLPITCVAFWHLPSLFKFGEDDKIICLKLTYMYSTRPNVQCTIAHNSTVFQLYGTGSYKDKGDVRKDPNLTTLKITSQGIIRKSNALYGGQT